MYLKHGWFEARDRKSLRREVVDGAMDIAGELLRENVSPQLIQTLAIKVRSAISLTDAKPQGEPDYGDKTRRIVSNRLDGYANNPPQLYSFIMDCLEHVHTPADLLGFYLHLIHISRMVQLLSTAMKSAPVSTIVQSSTRSVKKATKKKATKKKATKKKATKKKTTKKKAPRKKASRKASKR